MTSRPGWSVAELSRRTEQIYGRDGYIARQTIFEWIRKGGENASVASVRKIATALGDDFVTALLAAGNISIHASDEHAARILSADLEDDERQVLLDYLQAVRTAQQEAMRAELEARLSRPSTQRAA